jgi:hypothetical protein
MALTVSDMGEVEFLTRVLTYEGSKLKLYTNNATINESATAGTFTECAVEGYAQKTLLATTWTFTTTATVTASYAEQEFLLTTAVSCYGYLVTNSAGTTLLWAEAFPSVYTIPTGGGSIKVTLNISAG